MKFSVLGATALVLGLAMPVGAHAAPNIVSGTSFEAEYGYRYPGAWYPYQYYPFHYYYYGAFVPYVISDWQASGIWPLYVYAGASGGRFIGNFTYRGTVEHRASVARAGDYIAWVWYSTAYPGSRIELQVVQGRRAYRPIVTPPLASSLDPRFNVTFANRRAHPKNRWLGVPFKVSLPAGHFSIFVRNAGLVPFDYDRITFGIAGTSSDGGDDNEEPTVPTQ
ncbi:MAG: hypothetical protein LBP58_06520 [Azoarcus sp.]|jgi:hypothetical protein|nr:hypothetical protein [Azoarcus sp.]